MTKPAPRLDDLEELNAALQQRERLEAVYTFLEDHDASDELLDAVEEALGDLERWIDEDLVAKSHQAELNSPEFGGRLLP
ncbi:hypothetical protein [Nitratireductor sp.]|uniref:hypothetical protein n=1 Tax=Nitratireductor sp. TaxID=1872084 RepID=UPI002625D6AE|nr:hypothetical protein [Nitratireductor sp.]MCV0378962.1 hypothetical protein [Nitratireductor sp.]